MRRIGTESVTRLFCQIGQPYLTTVLQRDLAAYGFRPDALLLRRLLTMLATQQGGLLNMSAPGSSLGVSHHTVEHGMNLLEGVFLIRRWTEALGGSPSRSRRTAREIRTMPGS